MAGWEAVFQALLTFMPSVSNIIQYGRHVRVTDSRERISIYFQTLSFVFTTKHELPVSFFCTRWFAFRSSVSLLKKEPGVQITKCAHHV